MQLHTADIRRKFATEPHMLVAYSDALSAVATAHAAYDWAVTDGIPAKLGGTGMPMDHDAAVRYADKVVREAHGSALETARSNFLHDRGAKSLLGHLYGFQHNTLGQLLDGIDKVRVGQTSKMAVMARLTASLLMPAVAAHWVANGTADDGEPWYAWLSEAIAGELASAVPLVRESWKAVENLAHRGKVDFGELPVFQVAGNIINIPMDIAKELQGKDSRIIQHAFDALGQIGHIAGAGQVGHMLQYQRDVQSEKVQPDGTADYAKHLLVGGRSKKH
jgi:hypothetical protein